MGRSLVERVRRTFILTCEEVIEDFLIAYLEGRLNPQQAVRFEIHIARCRRCQEYIDQYMTTRTLLREDTEMEIDEVPEELERSVMDFISKNAPNQN